LKSGGNTEVIRSFKDARAEAIFEGRSPGKRFPADIIRATRRKLIMIAETRGIEDLRVPPANRLEALRGDRAGQHSVRINDQWRICFVWTGADAEDVEITDYH
jgi:proteic killer suppression protein